MEEETQQSDSLHILFVDWAGDEIGRLEVKATDRVSESLKELQGQIGTSPDNMMLMAMEGKSIDNQNTWAISCVSDWSSVRLTIVERRALNRFEPVELDESFKSEDVRIDSQNPSRVSGNFGKGGSHYALGHLGIELKQGSGDQGYFEVQSRAGFSPEFTRIGLATRNGNVNLPFLGMDAGGQIRRSEKDFTLEWSFCAVKMKEETKGAVRFVDDRVENMTLNRRESHWTRFDTGDRLGLAVDCAVYGPPVVRFFKNGIEVHAVLIPLTCMDLVLYPVFALCRIDITTSPGLPVMGPPPSV